MYKNRGLISDWDTLRLVLAIDRHGGVSGAARYLGVTHATVSRRLARAENDAGLVFFERLPAGLRLTEVGQAILAQALKTEPELDALERQLMNEADGIGGPLRVTISPLMMTDLVSADITKFATQHPEIQLEFVGDNNLLNLHRREADIAIRVTHKPPDTLWGRKLTEQSAGYYAASSWLETSSFGQGDLSAELPLISFGSWPTPIPKQLSLTCPNVQIVARSDDMVTAMQMVRAGLGITRMPRVLGDNLDGVTRITAFPWEPYFPIWMLTHGELRKVPRIEAFMRHIGAQFAMRRNHYSAVS